MQEIEGGPGETMDGAQEVEDGPEETMDGVEEVEDGPGETLDGVEEALDVAKESVTVMAGETLPPLTLQWYPIMKKMSLISFVNRLKTLKHL